MANRSRIWRVGLAPVAVAIVAVLGSATSAVAASSASTGGLFPSRSWQGGAPSTGHLASPHAAGLRVVASGLNQPHGLTVGPDGSLYVAEVGDAQAGAGCTHRRRGGLRQHLGFDRPDHPTGCGLDRGIPASPGEQSGRRFGQRGRIRGPGGQRQDLRRHPEHEHRPDHRSTDLRDRRSAPGRPGERPADRRAGDIGGQFRPLRGRQQSGRRSRQRTGDPPIDSDPYGVVAYHGGFAVADAAANDVLFVNPAGQISTLAVLPLIPEPSGGGTVMAQPVPTSLAVGPDGVLYVGELGGAAANDVGDVNVYRIVPGQAPTVYASGLTMIGGIAFDQAGRLLVLEIDTAGIDDRRQVCRLPGPSSGSTPTAAAPPWPAPVSSSRSV